MSTTSPESSSADYPKAPPPPDPTPSSAYIGGAGPAHPGQPSGHPPRVVQGRPHLVGPVPQGSPGPWTYNNVVQRPSPYWGLSIVSLFLSLFALLIPGVVAVLYSAQVQQRWDHGDVEGSARASRNAQIGGSWASSSAASRFSPS